MEQLYQILKILLEKEFEQQKYKKITSHLLDCIENIDLCLSEQEYKDFSILVSNILIYDYKKITNHDILIRVLAKLVLKFWSFEKNSRLINILIDELDKRFQSNQIFQIHCNIMNFLIILFSQKIDSCSLDEFNQRKVFDFLIRKKQLIFIDNQMVFLFFVLMNKILKSNGNDIEGVKSILNFIKIEKNSFSKDLRMQLIISKCTLKITKLFIHSQENSLLIHSIIQLSQNILLSDSNEMNQKILLNWVKIYCLCIEYSKLENLGIVKSESFKKDISIQKLEYLIHLFRQNNQVLLLQIFYQFSLLNLDKKQTFEYQRKILDVISDFYILLEKQSFDLKIKKIKEKKFFVILKHFSENYFFHLENKIKMKLWMYSVSKLLIFRDLDLKIGFQSLLFVMNYLLIELEEEFIKKEIQLQYLLKEFVVAQFCDSFTKTSLWEFFKNISKKSKKLNFQLLKICFIQIQLEISEDVQINQLIQNEEFYLGLMVILYQEQATNNENKNFDQKLLQKIKQNRQVLVNLQQDENLELESNFFIKSFIYLYCLICKSNRDEKKQLKEQFVFFLEKFKLLYNDLFLSTQKLEPIYLYIIKIYLKLKSKIKIIKGILVQSMREIFTDDDFQLENLILTSQVIRKFQEKEIFNKEIVMIFFSKIYNQLIKLSEYLTIEILKEFFPFFNINYLENIFSDSFVQDNEFIQETRSLKNCKIKEGFFNTFYSQYKLRWLRKENINKFLIMMLDIVKFIQKENYLDEGKKKKILLDILEKMKKTNYDSFNKSQRKKMLITLTILLYQNACDDDFIFDCLSEIFNQSQDCVDQEEIILCSKLGVILFQNAMNDQKKLNTFNDMIFKMLTTNENLDLLSGLLYYIFYLNSEDDLESMKLIISNIIFKVMRSDSVLSKRFLSLLIYNFLGRSEIFNNIFKQSLIFLQSSLLEKPSNDYFFNKIIFLKLSIILNNIDDNSFNEFDELNYQKKELLQIEFNQNEIDLIKTIKNYLEINPMLFSNNLNKIINVKFQKQNLKLQVSSQQLLIQNCSQNLILIQINNINKNLDYLTVDYLNFLQKWGNLYTFSINENNFLQKEITQTFLKLIKQNKITLSQILMNLEEAMNKNSTIYYPYASFTYKIFLFENFLQIFKLVDLKILLNLDIISLSKRLFDYFVQLSQNYSNEKMIMISFQFFELFLDKFQHFDEEGNYHGNLQSENLAAFYAAPLEAQISSQLKSQQIKNQVIQIILNCMNQIYQFVWNSDLILLKQSHKNLLNILFNQIDQTQDEIYQEILSYFIINMFHNQINTQLKLEEIFYNFFQSLEYFEQFKDIISKYCQNMTNQSVSLNKLKALFLLEDYSKCDFQYFSKFIFDQNSLSFNKDINEQEIHLFLEKIISNIKMDENQYKFLFAILFNYIMNDQTKNVSTKFSLFNLLQEILKKRIQIDSQKLISLLNYYQEKNNDKNKQEEFSLIILENLNQENDNLDELFAKCLIQIHQFKNIKKIQEILNEIKFDPQLTLKYLVSELIQNNIQFEFSQFYFSLLILEKIKDNETIYYISQFLIFKMNKNIYETFKQNYQNIEKKEI